MNKTHSLTRRSFHPSSPRHAVTADHQRFAVELAHLAEHIGLLAALDDQPVLDPDVVEEAGLERSLGRRRTDTDQFISKLRRGTQTYPFCTGQPMDTGDQLTNQAVRERSFAAASSRVGDTDGLPGSAAPAIVAG